MEFVQLNETDLRIALDDYFHRWMSPEATAITVDSIIKVAAQKDDRMSPLAELAADLRKHEERGRPKHSVLKSTDSTEMWDLNGAPGVCILGELVLRAKEVATKSGVALIGLRNSSGVHELSQYVEKLAEDGFIAIFFWNGGSYTTVPFGSSEPFFGTNPMAFGIPTTGRPIVADFATSQIPFRSLMIALQTGVEVPPGSGMDSGGLESTNPAKIYDSEGDDMVRLLPMGGGPKGSAIMLLAEVLTGALVGGVMAREATDDPFTPEEFGGLLFCIDARTFGFGDDFQVKVNTMAEEIRNSKPAPGLDKVYLPGDLSARRVAEAKGGFMVPSELIQMLSRES